MPFWIAATAEVMFKKPASSEPPAIAAMIAPPPYFLKMRGLARKRAARLLQRSPPLGATQKGPDLFEARSISYYFFSFGRPTPR
jgi:hypothetical protein